MVRVHGCTRVSKKICGVTLEKSKLVNWFPDSMSRPSRVCLIKGWVKSVFNLREAEVPNRWRITKNRKFFRPYFKTIFNLAKLVQSSNYRSISNSVLLNPIHTDANIAQLTKDGDYKYCFRYLYYIDGMFEDPRFDWFHLAKEMTLGEMEFLVSVKFLKSTKDRLKGCEYAVSPSQLVSDGLLVEMLAFAKSDLSALDINELKAIGLPLYSLGKAHINGLLRDFKMITANISIKLFKIEASKFSFGWFSVYPFSKIYFLFSIDNDGKNDLELLRSIPILETDQLFHKILFDEKSPLTAKVTQFIIYAVELRYEGHESVVPVLCNTAVENFIFESGKLLSQDFSKLEFKKRINGLQNILAGDRDATHLSQLYLKFVYEIRNKVAHEGKEISQFLSDYCIYVTICWIGRCIEHDKLKGLEEIKNMQFPFAYLDITRIRELTKVLRDKYGDNLERFVIDARDMNDYS